MSSPPRSPRHRNAGLLAAAALLLAGCAPSPDPVVTNLGSRPAGTSAAAHLPAPEHTPAAVPGVESCRVLPQQPPPRGGGGGAAVDRLPALRLSCLTPGPDIDLSALRGRPMLVNLWATWCGPCREEMPLLQATSEHHQQVQFLGVNTQDTTEAAAGFLGKAGVTYPQLVDPDGKLLDFLRVPGLPVTVVLDADGRIAGRHIGQLRAESIEALLANLT